MSRTDAFEVEIDAGVLIVNLATPDRGGAWPTVVVAPPLPDCPVEDGPLLDELRDALTTAGVAVAHFDPSPAGRAHPTSVAPLISATTAVLRALDERADVVSRRTGLLGSATGAIAAAAAARRVETIDRVALLNPITAADVAARVEKPNGLPSLLGRDAPESFVSALASTASDDDAAFHDRPLLVVHAAAHESIPPTCGAAYRDAMVRVGHGAQYEMIARADDTFSDQELRRVCIERMTRFFAEPRPWSARPLVPAAMADGAGD